MKTISILNATKVPIDLDGYIMHKSSSLEVIHLCLQSGQTVPQHPNNSDVIACLIEGEVILDSGENHTKLSLYDVTEIEKNLPRGFTNSCAGIARLLILKKL
jgi:quercetin dioxygenase-like cupin family protein